jgi:hypothetical protein
MRLTSEVILGAGSSSSLNESESLESPSNAEYAHFRDSRVIEDRDVRAEISRWYFDRNSKAERAIGIDRVLDGERPHDGVGHGDFKGCAMLIVSLIVDSSLKWY